MFKSPFIAAGLLIVPFWAVMTFLLVSHEAARPAELPLWEVPESHLEMRIFQRGEPIGDLSYDVVPSGAGVDRRVTVSSDVNAELSVPFFGRTGLRLRYRFTAGPTITPEIELDAEFSGAIPFKHVRLRGEPAPEAPDPRLQEVWVRADGVEILRTKMFLDRPAGVSLAPVIRAPRLEPGQREVLSMVNPINGTMEEVHVILREEGERLVAGRRRAVRVYEGQLYEQRVLEWVIDEYDRILAIEVLTLGLSLEAREDSLD